MVDRYTVKLPGYTDTGMYDHLIETFDSLNEFVSEAQRLYNPNRTYLPSRVVDNARDGIMHNEVPTMLEIASEAILASNELKDVMTFSPEFDVSGDYVDMGRYMSDEPECMVYNPLQPNRTVSPVITLVSSADSNFGGEWKTRGIIATALALALNRLGYATEMWADNYGQAHDVYQYQRIKVKDTLDELNPARLLYGFGDDSMLCSLAFGCYDGYPKLGYGKWRAFSSDYRGAARERGASVKALYPEGTIFITGSLEGSVTPGEVATVVAGELRAAGLLG